MESLKKIELERWHVWMEYFEKDWPKSIPGLNLLRMQRLLHKQRFPNPMIFYAPYGDMGAGLVALNYWEHVKEVIIITVGKNTDVLEKALLETKLIEWDKGIKIPYASITVVKLLREKILPKLPNLKVTYVPCFGFYNPLNTSKHVIIFPAGVEIKKVTIEHLDLVNSSHPHRYPGSDKHFAALINAGLGRGIFKNGEIAGFAFLNESGFGNHLYVLKKFRRLHLGKLLLKYFQNENVDLGKDTYAYIVINNTASINLTVNLGRETFGIHTWINIEPASKNSKL